MRRLRGRAWRAGLALALAGSAAACGHGSHPTRPLAVPLQIVPKQLPGKTGDPALTLDEYKPGADQIASAGKRSMISEGRVWQIRRGTTLVGALQVSTLKPRIDVTSAKQRDSLAGLVMSGTVQHIQLAGVDVVMARTADKIIYLWFGDQMFEVLQLKGAGIDPEGMLKSILDFQKPSGALRIRPHSG